MTEESKIEVPNFEATSYGKKIFTPKQWLERFRQYAKRKHKMDITELIRGAEMTQTGWTGKEAEVQEAFIWGIGLEALYQMTRAEYKTEPDRIAVKDLIRLFNEYFLPKRNTYHNRGEFFWTKQTQSETPEDFWRRLIEIEKECAFEGITAEDLLISKFMTAITDTKLRDKLMKEKKLELKKTIEMIKQNTYERKNRKNTIPEALISNREKEIKEEPIQRMERSDTRPKNKFINEKPCRFCNPPNWNPPHKCPALGKLCNNCGKKGHFARVCKQRENYKRKVRNVTEDESEINGGESDESETSINRIERINRITDRNKCLTTTVKVNGIEKEFIVDTGSPISIKPADENIMKQTEIQKVKHRYQDVNRNEVKFRGKIPADVEYENNKQKMQILITERNDITPLLGMDWMKKFKLTIGNIRTEENNQSERKRVIEKFPDLFKNNTTIKDTEINIQLKPGHYPVKQKARPIPLHLQEDVGKELERLIKTGHLEKVKHVDEDCFVSPVVITVKNDKSVKIALDSRKLNDSCIKIRPHMPNMEELLNQISVEITRDRTKELMMSKIDLDYAYGQMKLSKETSRQCVFAITGGKFSGYYRFKKGFYGLADIPTIFQEKIDRNLEYCTPAWLDDIIVVTRGDRKEHEKKLFDVLKKLKDAGYRASERKSEFFLKCTKWLGHEIDETGIKLNKEKVKAILELKHPENQKQLKSFLGAIQYLAKFLPRLSEKTDRLRKLLKKDSVWNWGKQQDEDFNSIKEMLTEEPCLAHYAKDRENIVTTDASKTGLGITLWQKQSDGEIKPIAFGSRYLNDSEKNYSIGELELLAVVWGLEKFRFYLYGKKVFLYTDHQALEPLIKRNRCNRQYSARLTRWLDRLAHFDIAIQHIAGSNLKFTDFLSRNPVESASNEDVYDEQYVINILSEHAELNVKYGTLFADQSQAAPERNKTTEEHSNNQSHQNRIFENNRDVNKMNKQTNSAPNKRQRKAKTESSIRHLNSNSNQNSNLLNNLPLFKNEMDRDYFHWGATAEIMKIIRRRRKSPETLRLVERRLEIPRPGTMRRKLDMNAQRQIWVPSRPNKRSRQEIAEIDGELLTRANRFGGGYQPLEERMEETQETPQPEMAEETEQEREGESQVIRGANFPILDLKAYNTEGKEAQFIQINQIIEKTTGNQKNTEETIKKAEFNFMLDLKTLIAKSSTDAELNRVRDAMRRGEKNTAPEHYRANFEKLNNKWGLTFNDDRIVVPAELRKKLLDTLHFGHAGTTKCQPRPKSSGGQTCKRK